MCTEYYKAEAARHEGVAKQVMQKNTASANLFTSAMLSMCEAASVANIPNQVLDIKQLQKDSNDWMNIGEPYDVVPAATPETLPDAHTQCVNALSMGQVREEITSLANAIHKRFGGKINESKSSIFQHLVKLKSNLILNRQW